MGPSIALYKVDYYLIKYSNLLYPIPLFACYSTMNAKITNTYVIYFRGRNLTQLYSSLLAYLF